MVNMTAYPTENPHPEQGPLWVQWDRDPSYSARHALMDGSSPRGWLNDNEAKPLAAQLGQNLPEGFTLAPVATGAALIAADPDGTEWEREVEVGVWRTNHSGSVESWRYPVRRVVKPAKVRVKVGDAYGRTIDGKRIIGTGIADYMPNGYYWHDLHATPTSADADGMVEVDPLDGDR